MKMMMSSGLRRTLSAATFLGLLCTLGCKNFFPSTDTSGSGSGSGTVTNTGDYVYVASSNNSSTTNPIYTVSGFSIGTNTLTALSGSPATLGFAPTTLVVNPANSLLYVAGATVLNGIINGYSIAADGSLTAITASDSSVLGISNVTSMVVSPDGQWLLALDTSTSEVVVDEYQIASTGLLTLVTGIQYALTGTVGSIVPNNISVAPNGGYVAVSLGTGGDVLFGFNTTTGALTFDSQVLLPSTSSADQAVLFSPDSSVLYIARSGTDGGVVPYTIASGGQLTLVSGSPFSLSTASNASGPASMVIDPTGTYLYVGNKVSSTISAFSIASGGVLTLISSSPYASGTTVTALAADNSKKYILATALNNNPDLQMYSFDATTLGQLDPIATAVTGDPTEPAGAVAIAVTH